MGAGLLIEPGVVYTAVGSTVGAIVFLFGLLWSRAERESKKLDACEVRHEQTSRLIVQLTADVNYLKGQQHAIDVVGDRIESIVEGLRN